MELLATASACSAEQAYMGLYKSDKMIVCTCFLFRVYTNFYTLIFTETIHRFSPP